jgi:hypothetical protein
VRRQPLLQRIISSGYVEATKTCSEGVRMQRDRCDKCVN